MANHNSIRVPSIFKNFPIQSGCAGHAGATTAVDFLFRKILVIIKWMNSGTRQTPTQFPTPPRIVRLRPERALMTHIGRFVILPIFALLGLFISACLCVRLYAISYGTPLQLTLGEPQVVQSKHISYRIPYQYSLNGIERKESQDVTADVFGQFKSGDHVAGKLVACRAIFIALPISATTITTRPF